MTYSVDQNWFNKTMLNVVFRRRRHILEETLRKTDVLIAALNEEDGLKLTLSELVRNLPISNIIVVDGHSTDRTVEVAKNCGANIFYQNGKGKGDAVLKALECIRPEADFVVLIDADFTYPAEYIPFMIEILEQNSDVGMVCGNRFSGEIEKNALHNQFFIGNKLLGIAHNMLIGVDLKDPLTGLRAVRADVLRDWKVKSKGFDIEVEMNSFIQKHGYRTIEIPINYRQRIGQKKLKVKDGFTILKRILLESFSSETNRVAKVAYF